MAETLAPAYEDRIEALQNKLAELRDRGSPRRFLPPATDAEIAAIEAHVGAPLPPEIRAFYARVTAGEVRTGEPAIATLEAALAAGTRPAEPFPFGDREAAELIERDRHKQPGEMPPALDAPPHGVLAVMDQSDSLNCVVLNGEQRGKMWQSWDAGWTPMYAAANGAAAQLDFLEWARGVLDEALAAAPPPITAATTSIDLFGLGLTEVPPAVAAAAQAKRLVLTANAISDLPPFLGDLAALEELRLSGNPIRALPASLSRLTRLRILDLSATALSALPPWTGDLCSLTQLHLTGAKLESLPAEVGGLSSLQVLALGRNRLTVLPDSIGRLAALTDLDVSGNALTALPESLSGLSSLRVLKLANNPLRTLPDSLRDLPLETLDLEALPDLVWDRALSIAATMPRLRTLRIQQTLSTLPPSIGMLRQLTTLKLVGVGLREVPPEITSLPAIELLGLDQNHLTTLPDAVGAMPALKTVVLFANPISKEEVTRLREKWPHLEIEHF